MKIKVVCEGKTETGLRKFIRRILDDKFPDPKARRKISISFDFMGGVPEVLKHIGTISEKSIAEECISVICLVDLHRIHEHFPEPLRNALSGQDFLKLEIPDRVKWLKDNITKYLVAEYNQDKVTVHVAVYEVEAWLISDIDTLGKTLRKRITDEFPNPEAVDDEKPPHKRLEEKYRYKKSSHGKKCLEELNYELAMQKCPQFKSFIEYILGLCEQASSA